MIENTCGSIRRGSEFIRMDQSLARAARRRAGLRRSSRLLGTARRNQTDACGCAMGARFLAAALIASILWYAWRWQSSGLSVGAVVIRVSAWSFLASGIGKVVGIAASRRPAPRVFSQRIMSG